MGEVAYAAGPGRSAARARPGGGARVSVWALHMALPLLALWWLIAQPQLDLTWEHRPGHFVLVAGTAALAVVLALLVGGAARRRGDARLFLVSLVFQVTAAFLGVHALATPGVVLDAPTATFTAATPIGLFLGGIAALVSAIEFSLRRCGPPDAPAGLAGRRPVAAPRRLHGVVAGLRTARALPGRAAGGRGHRGAVRRRGTGALRRRGRPVPADLPAPAAGRPAVGADRLRPAGRGLGRDRLRPELAAVVVGVARPDAGGLRVHRLQRLRAVPSRGLRRRAVRRRGPGPDGRGPAAGLHGRARGDGRGAPRPRGRRATTTGRWAPSPRGSPSGSTSPSGSSRCSSAAPRPAARAGSGPAARAPCPRSAGRRGFSTGRRNC